MLCGLGILGSGADEFVVAAARLAVTLRLSSVVVGAVVIGFGTGAPELLVSSLGNVLGSNVFNSTAVAGVSGFIGPARITDAGVTVVAAISMVGVAALAWLFLGLGGQLRRWEASILLVVYGGTLVLVS